MNESDDDFLAFFKGWVKEKDILVWFNLERNSEDFVNGWFKFNEGIRGEARFTEVLTMAGPNNNRMVDLQEYFPDEKTMAFLLRANGYDYEKCTKKALEYAVENIEFFKGCKTSELSLSNDYADILYHTVFRNEHGSKVPVCVANTEDSAYLEIRVDHGLLPNRLYDFLDHLSFDKYSVFECLCAVEGAMANGGYINVGC